MNDVLYPRIGFPSEPTEPTDYRHPARIPIPPRDRADFMMREARGFIRRNLGDQYAETCPPEVLIQVWTTLMRDAALGEITSDIDGVRDLLDSRIV